MKPFFSIILPTLGKVDQWDNAICSVVSQTFKDWELIAIDSGPEEHSRPVAEGYKDSRITYYNTERENPRLNWDLGYRKSSGEYIIWFEDDNYLLPRALEALFDLAEKTGADIVTAEHAHWRGARHPIESQRNQLIINLPPFTGKVRGIDPKDIVRRLLGWPQHDSSIRARFHNSETAIKKELADKAIEKIKEINFESTSSHALRLAVIALAKSIVALDSPVAIVGQTGESLTETWPAIVSPIMKRAYYRYRLSPVTAQTYSSYRLENMLLVKQFLAEELSNMPLNMPLFLRYHAKELRFANLSWKDFGKAWREAYRAVADPKHQAVELKREVLWNMLEAAAIKILKIVDLFPIMRRIFENRRKSKKNQYIVSLGDEGIHSIKDAAARLPEILHQLTKQRHPSNDAQSGTLS